MSCFDRLNKRLAGLPKHRDVEILSGWDLTNLSSNSVSVISSETIGVIYFEFKVKQSWPNFSVNEPHLIIFEVIDEILS